MRLVLLGLIGALVFATVILTFTPFPSSGSDKIHILDKAPYVNIDRGLIYVFANKTETYVATIQFDIDTVIKASPSQSIAVLTELKICDVKTNRCTTSINMISVGPGTYKLYVKALGIPGEICISFLPLK